MKRARKDYLIEVSDDGLPTQHVGPWAAEKYRRLGMYAEMFATGMKKTWPTRVYVDPFSGPGYSRIRDTQKTVLASPLIALTVPDRFNRYVFSDESPQAVDALRVRVARHGTGADVHFLQGDANPLVHDVITAIPADGRTLTFCFLDPFSLGIRFQTVRSLAEARPVDFMILLALGVDANRNMAQYVKDESTRIDDFLGNREWRSRWREMSRKKRDVMHFLATEYARAMVGIGYLDTLPEEMHPVRSYQKNLPLYYLAFFSRHPLGKTFWREVQKYSTDQLPLDFSS